MRSRPFLLACALSFLASCSGNDGPTGPGSGGPPTSTISIAVPPSARIPPGGTLQVVVTITRTEYTGPVFVSFSGLPAGVTAPAVSSTSTSQLSIPLVADPTASPNAANVQVNAQGINVSPVSTTFLLTVAPG